MQETLTKETLAGGLAMALKSLSIDVLTAIVVAGEDEFIKRAQKTDTFNLSDAHYKKIFRGIARKVRHAHRH